MITHKSSFGAAPFHIKFKWRKADWYLFPQGWGTYNCLKGNSKVTHVLTRYRLSWLFMEIIITTATLPKRERV